MFAAMNSKLEKLEELSNSIVVNTSQHQFRMLRHLTSMFDCIICLDVSKDETPIVIDCCHAIVYQGCIARWTRSNASCPACRRPNPTTSTVKLNGVCDLFREVKLFVTKQQNQKSQQQPQQQQVRASTSSMDLRASTSSASTTGADEYDLVQLI